MYVIAAPQKQIRNGLITNCLLEGHMTRIEEGLTKFYVPERDTLTLRATLVNTMDFGGLKKKNPLNIQTGGSVNQ